MLSAEPKAKADNTYQDLELNLIMLSYYTLFWRKKEQTQHCAHGTQLTLLWEIMHCVLAAY